MPATRASVGPSRTPATTVIGIRAPGSAPSGTSMNPETFSPRRATADPIVSRVMAGEDRDRPTRRQLPRDPVGRFHEEDVRRHLTEDRADVAMRVEREVGVSAAPLLLPDDEQRRPRPIFPAKHGVP